MSTKNSMEKLECYTNLACYEAINRMILNWSWQTAGGVKLPCQGKKWKFIWDDFKSKEGKNNEKDSLE